MFFLLFVIYLSVNFIVCHSQKEKLALFTQISDCVQAPALRANANYLTFVSNAVSILLMFCEDCDPVIRMRYENDLLVAGRFSKY